MTMQLRPDLPAEGSPGREEGEGKEDEGEDEGEEVEGDLSLWTEEKQPSCCSCFSTLLGSC